MLLDPELKVPMLRILRRVAQKKLGFRYLMDVIPTDAGFIRGSHGLIAEDPAEGPVWISSIPFGTEAGATLPPREDGQVPMTSVKERILSALQRPL